MVTISKCNWLINIYWSPWARRSNFGTKLKCWRLHDNWKFHILGTRVHFSYFLSKSCLAPAVCEEIIKRAEADNFQVLSCNIFPLHLFSLCFYLSPRWRARDPGLRLRGGRQGQGVLHHRARGVQHRGLLLQGGRVQLRIRVSLILSVTFIIN